MPPELESRIEHARSASAEELKSLVHEPDERILLALLENPHFDETHAEMLLDRLDLSSNLLGALAQNGKWLASEGVRLRLARNPRTPKWSALAAVRQLFLLDLVRLSLTPSAPADIRRFAEEAILKHIPHLPIGEKLTLARRGPPRAAGTVLAEGHPQALKLALGNPFLTEGQVLKVLAKTGLPERVVTAIAQHPKWSCQYNVRVALIRSPAAPEPFVRAVLKDVTLRDLEQLASAEELAADRRNMIAQEWERRSNGKPAAQYGRGAGDNRRDI
jgi:hypothetical protein